MTNWNLWLAKAGEKLEVHSTHRNSEAAVKAAMDLCTTTRDYEIDVLIRPVGNRVGGIVQTTKEG